MADDKDAPDGDGAGEAGAEGGGKKKLIMMIVVGVVLIGLSVGGTLMALKMLAPDEPPVSAEGAYGEAAAETVPEKKKSAIYFPLKPAIIVNFQARGRQRYLQAELTLMTRENDVVEAIELHMPMIRNALVLQFGGQLYEDLQTAEGKELLRQQALENIQALLQKEIDKPGVEQVLFTNFVMQ